MTEAKEKELKIVDYVTKNGTQRVLPLRFTIHDGLYPLLAAPVIYKGQENPYFTTAADMRPVSRVRINLNGPGLNYKYKKGRSFYSNNSVVLYSGFLSAMGVPSDFDYMPSSLSGDEIRYRMKGDVDLFCLAVVPSGHLPEVGRVKHPVHSRYLREISSVYTKVDLTKVKLLVSIEKLRKTLFMKDRYTATIRSTILKQIRDLETRTEITVEDVPDEYLNRFKVSPNAVRTNSIVEIIQLGNEIKDSVFSNLNKEAV